MNFLKMLQMNFKSFTCPTLMSQFYIKSLLLTFKNINFVKLLIWAISNYMKNDKSNICENLHG